MDILGILENYLGFIERFYNGAAEPFETTKRKVEANEEPFVPKYAPGDYDGFEYQVEWNEADACLRVLGHCSFGLLEKALHDYLREFIMRETEVVEPRVLPKVLAQYKEGNWFKKYCAFLAQNTSFDWARSPTIIDRIEQIILSRNDISHYEMIGSIRPRQSEEHFRKYPVSAFADEWEIEAMSEEGGNPEFPSAINITREKLIAAITNVRQFCGFVEAQATK